MGRVWNQRFFPQPDLAVVVLVAEFDLASV
jgi:hypothetical protein